MNTLGEKVDTMGEEVKAALEEHMEGIFGHLDFSSHRL